MFLYNEFSKYPIIHTGVTKSTKIHRFSVTERSKTKKGADIASAPEYAVYGVAGDGDEGETDGSAEAGEGLGASSA